MANLTLNLNQFAMTAILGMITRDPQPNTQICMINPAYAGSQTLVAGTAVKLVSAVGPQIIVEPTASITADEVFGVIIHSTRRDSYSAPAYVNVACRGNVIMLKSSAAIVRGTKVATTNATVSTNDPTIATNSTTLNQITGVALGQCSAANILIPVLIDPSKNP